MRSVFFAAAISSCESRHSQAEYRSTNLGALLSQKDDDSSISSKLLSQMDRHEKSFKLGQLERLDQAESVLAQIEAKNEAKADKKQKETTMSQV